MIPKRSFTLFRVQRTIAREYPQWRPRSWTNIRSSSNHPVKAVPPTASLISSRSPRPCQECMVNVIHSSLLRSRVTVRSVMRIHPGCRKHIKVTSSSFLALVRFTCADGGNSADREVSYLVPTNGPNQHTEYPPSILRDSRVEQLPSTSAVAHDRSPL